MTEYNETREFDEYPLPKVGELPESYGRRVQAWTGKALHRAARAERRMVRIETRLTMALRFLGLHPGVGVDPEAGSVTMIDGKIVASTVDVKLKDINLCAVLSGLKGDIEVYVGGQRWGVVTVRQ